MRPTSSTKTHAQLPHSPLHHDAASSVFSCLRCTFSWVLLRTPIQGRPRLSHLDNFDGYQQTPVTQVWIKAGIENGWMDPVDILSLLMERISSALFCWPGVHYCSLLYTKPVDTLSHGTFYNGTISYLSAVEQMGSVGPFWIVYHVVCCL